MDADGVTSDGGGVGVSLGFVVGFGVGFFVGFGVGFFVGAGPQSADAAR